MDLIDATMLWHAGDGADEIVAISRLQHPPTHLRPHPNESFVEKRWRNLLS
jgi:hypothetical protein